MAESKSSVETYSVTPSKDGVRVVVTTGSLAGKSVTIISTPPSAAYFQESTKEKAKG